VIGLQLYFPNVREVVRGIGLISETTADPNSGFWAELSDDKRSADGIAALLARHRELGDRGCPRFHTRLRATIRNGEGRSFDGYITNISRSGAFLKVDSLPPAASVVVPITTRFPLSVIAPPVVTFSVPLTVEAPRSSVLASTNVTLLPKDGHFIGRVHVYLSIFDGTGKNVGFHHQVRDLSLSSAEHEKAVRDAFRYQMKVRLDKGDFTLAITMRDDLSNEIGTAVQRVKL